MAPPPHELAQGLGEHAEAVCRHYLSNGHRQGRYWIVGDVRNTPGRSMFVRLCGPETGPGAAGHWADAATGEHGDLLDLIRESCGLIGFRDVVEEARRFLGPARFADAIQLVDDPPYYLRHDLCDTAGRHSTHDTSSEAARRLVGMSVSIADTLAETYLRGRGIRHFGDIPSLRFHPRCYFRADPFSPLEIRPALIAAVTDNGGAITGIQRTWLAEDGSGKAPTTTPRRAMGRLAGNAVRFDQCDDVLAVGEGIETMLSLRTILPTLPLAAALSAANLASFVFPSALRRLYVIRDNDDAGRRANNCLVDRASAAGIDAVVLTPILKDFNDDLCRLDRDVMRTSLITQLPPEDIDRFGP